jgi:hypothetical protein
MPEGPQPIPTDNQSQLAAKSINLDGYPGQAGVDFCGKYGSENHGAHFVSHVLQLRSPGAAL